MLFREGWYAQVAEEGFTFLEITHGVLYSLPGGRKVEWEAPVIYHFRILQVGEGNG